MNNKLKHIYKHIFTVKNGKTRSISTVRSFQRYAYKKKLVYNEESDEGYFLEVDVQYLENYMSFIMIYHFYQKE